MAFMNKVEHGCKIDLLCVLITIHYNLVFTVDVLILLDYPGLLGKQNSISITMNKHCKICTFFLYNASLNP